MPFSFDRAGFPLVWLPSLCLEVQLLPVTKVQFERFAAEPNTFGDNWYDALLQTNPRVSYRRFNAENREGLFLTGILPDEALAFAHWLGPGYDLPSVDEWRKICIALAGEPAPLIGDEMPEGPAQAILSQLEDQLRPSTLLDLSLMRGGVVEWAGQEKRWIGLGAPRPAFQPNLWDPLTMEVQMVDPLARVRYVGFRLVKR